MQSNKVGRMGWVGAAVGLLLCGSVMAAEGARQETLLKMKSGVCRFKVLDAKGVTPMTGANFVLTGVKEDAATLKKTVDETGFCEIKVPDGRFVVTVNGRHLAVLDVAEAHTVTECRIIVPSGALPVGGAEAETEVTRRGLAAWLTSGSGAMKPVIVGGVAVLAGTGAYIAYDESKDDDKKDDVTPPVPTKKGSEDVSD